MFSSEVISSRTIADEKLNLFTKAIYNDSVVREEFHTYGPHTKSFDNSDEIEISINQQDAFISMHEAALFISGNYEEINGSGTTPDTIGTCTITNNAGLFLFESISFELNGKEIDRVKDPGMVCLIKALLSFNSNEMKGLSIAGWIIEGSSGLDTLNVTDKSFTFRIPLKFIFGLFNDYKRVLRGRQTLRLVRSRNDVNCFKSSGTKTLKFKLNTIELKTKLTYPNDLIKLNLLSEINKDKPIVVPFRKWDFHELPALRTADSDIWAVKTTTTVERPRCIIVAFQTNKKDNVTEDVSGFDHLNITDLRVFLNGDVYPYENMNLNWEKWHYSEIYHSYVDFQSNFLGKSINEPYLSYASFKTQPLFVVDTSKQLEQIQSYTVDVKLEFRAAKNFPTNTKAYCIIIHDSLYNYLPLTGIVKNVI